MALQLKEKERSTQPKPKSASYLPKRTGASDKQLRTEAEPPARKPAHRLRLTVERRAKQPDQSSVVMTVGHSTRTLKEFVALLLAHGVKQLIDVRTIPRSRHNPQFNRGTGYLARSKKRESVTGIWLDSAACGMRAVTRSMQGGEMPAFTASLITCRHRNFKQPWSNSSNSPKNGKPQ